MSATAPGGRSASFMTGACVSTGTATAALLTFLLRFLQAATDDDAAAEEVEEEEEEEEEDDEEEVVTADELVLLELVLSEDDLEVVDDEVVVGLTEVELEVGLVEVEVVVGLVEVEVLLSDDVSVLSEEIDVDIGVDEAAAGDDVTWTELMGREYDCEDDDRVVEEEDEEDIVELETEEDDCARAEDEDDRTEEDDDRAAELVLNDVEVAAAKLELDKLEDEGFELLLLLATEELLLDEADVTAADDAEIELDIELDDDRLIDRGSATCEEVGAAGMDVLNELEDERATDEIVEDGFTDVEVALVEVVLLLVFLLDEDEDEVEEGFCIIV